MSVAVRVSSAGGIVVSASLLVLVLTVSVDISVAVTCVCVVFVMVCEDVIKVRHGVYLCLEVVSVGWKVF